MYDRAVLKEIELLPCFKDLLTISKRLLVLKSVSSFINLILKFNGLLRHYCAYRISLKAIRMESDLDVDDPS